jgi:hypothetical protein
VKNSNRTFLILGVIPLLAGMPTASAATVTGSAVIGNISPSTAVAGGPAFTLTVNGTGFTPETAIYFNAPIPTTFVSASQLTAEIIASSIASTFLVDICVGPPGGSSCTSTGASNSLPFTITASGNLIASLNPSSVQAGGPAFTLSVAGLEGFPSTSVILWNGMALSTSMQSPTEFCRQGPFQS